MFRHETVFAIHVLIRYSFCMPYRSPVTSGIRVTGFNLSWKIVKRNKVGRSVGDSFQTSLFPLQFTRRKKKTKRANSEILSKVVVVSERAAKHFFVARNTEPQLLFFCRTPAVLAEPH